MEFIFMVLLKVRDGLCNADLLKSDQHDADLAWLGGMLAHSGTR